MGLSAGARVGHYEIVELIGVGGMGEVYRARDTKLERDVAIKVLPEELSHDPGRLARFEREAKLLASLTHPGIATLYGIEHVEGKPALIMELVEGETLAERVARGVIPYEEAVALFTQIADAVGAAHKKGIIHRDLKPANIKLTPDGKIKILDFGLAKLVEPESAERSGAASQSPTLTKNTALGAILGTASYMSPEQARGKPVDKRTDIWAFGCCLYEALSSRKAFDGETVTDVLSRVLQLEPEWSALPPDVPAPLPRLLKRCLDKNPDRRVHDIADARLDLEESLGAPSVADDRRTANKLPMVATAVVAAVLGAFLSWLAREGVPTPPVKRFSINLPPGDEFLVGGIEGPLVAISPDGSKVVYAGVREGKAQLFLRRIGEHSSEPVAGTENGRMPFFSPDGQWIGFAVGLQLKRVALDGGPTVEVSQLTDWFLGGSWPVDREILFGQFGAESLFWVSPNGRVSPDAFQRDDEAVAHRWPQVLPNGQGAVFVTGPWDEARIAVLSLETGNAHVLDELGTYPRYATSGHIVFARERTLFAVPFDPIPLALTGPAVPVLDNVGQGGAGEAYFDISQEGTLVYISGQTKPPTGLVWVDREGQSRALGPMRSATWNTPRLSPNGELILAGLEPQDAPPNLWLLGTARPSLMRFTTLGEGDTDPVWSPDGDAVFFLAGRRLVRQAIDSSEQLQNGTACGTLTSISSDGHLFVCDERGESGDWDIALLRVNRNGENGANGESEPLVSSRFNEHDGRLSPDDRWLAYVSDESGRVEIYVQPFPGPGRKTSVSTEGGAEPAWSRDGHELFYRRGQELYAVPFSADGEAGQPTLLFTGKFRITDDNHRTHYDVSLDGEHFVMIQSEASDVRPEIHVVLNWFTELERLAPSR